MNKITIDKKELIINPLWFHKRGLLQTSSGYGKKIITEYMIKYNNRMHRIYCCVFSNCGTLYIISKKEHIIIDIIA